MSYESEPSALLVHLFEEHILKYGEPDLYYRFDSSNSNIGAVLPYLDVFVWEATADVPVTTFTTIGMADRGMEGVDYRAELHFTIRGTLTEEECAEVAIFLCNLAAYPFLQTTHFDYYHLVSPAVTIPKFGSCRWGLFHPSFTDGGWDAIEHKGTTVRLFNFIPLTDTEVEMAKSKGVHSLLNWMYDHHIDIFADRPIA